MIRTVLRGGFPDPLRLIEQNTLKPSLTNQNRYMLNKECSYKELLMRRYLNKFLVGSKSVYNEKQDWIKTNKNKLDLSIYYKDLGLAVHVINKKASDSPYLLKLRVRACNRRKVSLLLIDDISDLLKPEIELFLSSITGIKFTQFKLPFTFRKKLEHYHIFGEDNKGFFKQKCNSLNKYNKKMKDAEKAQQEEWAKARRRKNIKK